jgi:hypothetical protein
VQILISHFLYFKDITSKICAKAMFLIFNIQKLFQSEFIDMWSVQEVSEFLNSVST